MLTPVRSRGAAELPVVPSASGVADSTGTSLQGAWELTM